MAIHIGRRKFMIATRGAAGGMATWLFAFEMGSSVCTSVERKQLENPRTIESSPHGLCCSYCNRDYTLDAAWDRANADARPP